MIRKDRAALVAELESLGWRADPTNPGCLRAPESLVQHLAERSFHPYEADILQELVYPVADSR